MSRIAVVMLVRATRTWVIFRAHPVRGESHIQRNAYRKVATRVRLSE